MARTTKSVTAQKKNAGRGKAKSVQVIPDYTFTVCDENVVIDVYEREKSTTCKITLCNAFIIYARVIDGKNGAFISYPSFKNKDGEYINQAFCFDKDVIAEINAGLEEYFDAV